MSTQIVAASSACRTMRRHAQITRSLRRSLRAPRSDGYAVDVASRLALRGLPAIMRQRAGWRASRIIADRRFLWPDPDAMSPRLMTRSSATYDPFQFGFEARIAVLISGTRYSIGLTKTLAGMGNMPQSQTRPARRSRGRGWRSGLGVTRPSTAACACWHQRGSETLCGGYAVRLGHEQRVRRRAATQYGTATRRDAHRAAAAPRYGVATPTRVAQIAQHLDRFLDQLVHNRSVGFFGALAAIATE